MMHDPTAEARRSGGEEGASEGCRLIAQLTSATNFISTSSIYQYTLLNDSSIDQAMLCHPMTKPVVNPPSNRQTSRMRHPIISPSTLKMSHNHPQPCHSLTIKLPHPTTIRLNLLKLSSSLPYHRQHVAPHLVCVATQHTQPVI